MSKADSGPAANTFPNPRKSGWMFKQGGSGISSHWRKRWFIADHHYLFYYKGPNDKKPVGILCLPEYESCHTLESKKPNSFMLDRGNDSDTATKDYVLHTESKEEMEAWIQAITEEIKPILGRDMPNGHPAMRGGKKSDDVKIDQKALDELTKSVSEGPKLSHLTAQRPRMKGRRPPKRYAVFHEDDSKEETPPNTPSPSISPAPSPVPSPGTATKRGHRPSVPLKPKSRSTSAPNVLEGKEVEKLSEQLGTITESEGSVAPNARKTSKPLPPKKPPKEQDATIPLIPTRPSPPPKPVPAKRHSKDESIMNAVEQPSGSRPTPPKKPRPQPPVKPRTGTEPTIPTEPSSPPQPPKKPRTSLPTINAIELPPTPTELSPPTRPVPVPRPIPVPRKRPKGQESLDEDAKKLVDQKEPEIVLPPPPVPKAEEEVKAAVEEVKAAVEEVKAAAEEVKAAAEEVVKLPVEEEKLPVEEEKEEDRKHAEDKVERAETELEEEQNVAVEIEEDDAYEIVEIVPQREEPKEEKVTKTVKESLEKVSETPQPEVVASSSPKTRKTPDYTATPPTEPTTDKDRVSVEPTPEAAAKAELTASNESTSENESILSPNYELMEPSLPIKLNPKEPDTVLSPPEEDYEPMEFGVGAEHIIGNSSQTTPEGDKSHEYEEPTEWHEEDIPLSPLDNEYELPPDADYDVPPPPRPASGFSTYDVPKLVRSSGPSPELIPAVDLQPSYPAAASIGPSTTVVPQEQKRRSEVEPLPSAAIGNDAVSASASQSLSDTSPTSNKLKKLERDSLGYTKVLKKSESMDGRSGISYSISSTASSAKSDETAESGIVVDKRLPPIESSLDTIPATLKQAREILRLAKAVKTEAEEMKGEVQRELELARRERHDAELLKKNAGEILKMAKERLHSASAK